MEQDVFILTSDGETYIGKVRHILEPAWATEGEIRIDNFLLALRDVVDGLVFGDENKNYAVFTIELR